MGRIILPSELPSENYIAKIKEEYVSTLFKKKGVRGVGIGHKFVKGIETLELCISVAVKEKLQLSELFDHDKIPSEIHGVKTDIIVFSKIFPRSLTSKIRPARPGYSIGHPSVTAGTFGCVVMRGPNRCVLSNNHVLAAENAAHVGDAIIQPGSYDGGNVNTDTVAYLDKYPEVYDGCNADCATATQINEESISGNIAIINSTPSSSLELGDGIGSGARNVPKGSQDIGVPISKVGRTSEYTTAPLMFTNFDAIIPYSGGDLLIRDSLVSGLLNEDSSEPGDSGSLGMVGTTAVGLLFAGGVYITPIGIIYGITFYNKIANVCGATNCYIGDIQTSTPIIANKTK